MPRNIDQILSAAAQRPLSTGELELLGSYIRDLERRNPPATDSRTKSIQELEGKLADCRALLRKYDINEIMD
ncbi:hypothetical protein [Halomonas alkalicola]|uniref:hypothetical protein n=1 Tax=Halomonas alkalicola TaxID=1930622 RepID=UPI00265DEC3C|nr:hypothetical protein [Halomonas alkalicola]